MTGQPSATGFQQRRIETQDAKRRRSQRQHWAAPGGAHDKLVRFLARALPMGVGVVAALMVITPLGSKGEISFLLDRDKVAVITERLRVDNALYRGQDNKGRPFSLTADEAVQKSSVEGIVRLNQVVARIMLDDGPAWLNADTGQYAIANEVISVNGPVRVQSAGGYNMVANDVSVSLVTRTLAGDGGVEGAVPAGTFRADRIEANLDERTVTLIGNARMRMEPGKMRMP